MRLQFVIACVGVTVIVLVAATTSVLVLDLRERSLAEKRRSLETLTSVLSESIDRSFQSVELVQGSELAAFKSQGINSRAEFAAFASSYDTYQRLSAEARALPFIDAFVLTDAQGILLGFSRSWPAPQVLVPDQDPHEAFSAEPHLGWLIGRPLKSPVTGEWEVPIARKITGPNGEFFGVLTGVIRMAYFEQIFQTVTNSPHSTIALAHTDGFLLVQYPHVEAAIGKSLSESSLLQGRENGRTESGAKIALLDQQERIIWTQKLPKYPIVLVTTTTVSDALADWRHGAAITSLAALLIGGGVGGVVLLGIWIVGRKLREQNFQRDVALENMSQGLVMFDSAARLVICNDRYRALYHLPPNVAHPGCALLELLKHRVAGRTFPGDPEQYVRDLRVSIAAGRETKQVVALADGRFIAVVNRPMRGGGWIATHEDITEAKRQEASFLLLLKSNPVPMWVFDREDLQFLTVNDAAVAHYGFRREQFLAMTVWDVHPAAERPGADEIRSNTSGGAERRRTWRHLKSDGVEIDVAIYSRALRYDGRPAVLAAVIDVTEQKRAEAALTRVSQELIEKQFAIDQAVIVTTTDAKGVIIYANDNMCKISGFSRQELLGANHRIMKSGSHPAAYYRDMYQQLASGKVWRGEVCNRTKGGSLYWVDTTIVPQLDIDGKPVAYMAIRVDITPRKLAEAKISHMAKHDPLTGLGNRSTLNEKLEEALARSRRYQETFAVLLLDLDGFKNVNDTLGHAAGDELLKALAKRLSGVLRETDLLARLGGDEFAIIQSCASNQRDAAITLALRVLEIVATPFNLSGHETTVGTSIGIAVAPDDGASAGELLQKADLALYRVKADGRNNFRFFDSELGSVAISRLRLLKDLRVALTRGEFELHYQPVFDVKTGRPCTIEALVRWRHPSEGLIPPDRFIPLAEETGLMEPLGDWIIERGFADAANWPEDIKIAVNLSAVQFRSGRLFDVLLCALVESGLPPERLELEITESILLQNTDSNRAVLQQLKNIGVSIVLDDFGTGYSSLNYLTTFPFDKIKIDKSFTNGLTQRGACTAVIASVLTLARELDIKVTAEGVETLQQFELLRAAGVHQVQGYFFGRPTPLSEIDFSQLESKVQGSLVA